MAKTGRYIHSVSDNGDKSAVGTTFVAGKAYALSLNDGNAVGNPVGSRFMGRIEAVAIKIKTIAGGATKITMKGSMSNGSADFAILPDTQADIALEVGSTTAGTVVYLAGLDWINATDTLTIVCKTDAGTVTLDRIVVTWSE